MALIPKDAYPAQTNAADPGYPHGKARNVAVAGDGTGTPLEQLWVNDLWGFLQALLDEASVTPSGTPDKVGASQYLSALLQLITNPTTISVANDAFFSGALVVNGNARFYGKLQGAATDVIVDDNLRVEGNAEVLGEVIADRFVVGGKIEGADGTVVIDNNLSVESNATVLGNLVIGGKIDGTAGTAVFDNNILVEGRSTFQGATRFPVSAGANADLTLVEGTVYIADGITGAHDWTLPEAADGAWVEITNPYSFDLVIKAPASGGGVALVTLNAVGTGGGSGNFKWYWARLYWRGGAWRLGPHATH